ncbi:MAG TPA: sigma-70 family RNA polymerase sigma factor [Chloroflexota bacterium]|jgi:RNA polymerase sigma-70 factor (ECF subfamily)|nr:sigma-70 family RNA polymerase sigma factor [Chloroflexota bacterium]
MATSEEGPLDRAAFEQLVAEYAERLYNLALRITGVAADAEDAVQEAFASAYRHRDQFRGGASPRTWLYRITVNAALQRVRERAPREYLEEPLAERQELTDWPAHSDDPAVVAELRQQLEAALGALAPDLRAAVILRDVEGLSAREAAEALGISEAAFKSRLHRGRVLLRERLSEYLRG